MGQPEPDITTLNQALVDQLKTSGAIQTPPVEAAFRNVLRHYFVPGTPLEQVYADRVILTKQDPNGKWISSSSQPAIMAIMLEQLGLEPGQRVLEIGAGTGYNAALMAHIVGEMGQVITIDIDQDLVDATREHLEAAGMEQVQVIRADGGFGYPDAAPFDRIILTVAAPDITPAWWDQLKPGGRLVLPLMLRGSMKSVAFEKVDDYLTSLSVKDCGFVPLRGEFASSPWREVPLGPNPDLYLETDEPEPDTHAVYDLLMGPSQDQEVHLEAALWDVLGGSLWTWLALQEPHMCKLVARNEMVEREIVPPLLGIDGKQKSAGTVAQFNGIGLVALMRPPGDPLPFYTIGQFPEAEQITLFVRQLGSDHSLAERMIEQIQAWDAAGRPSAEGMRIRAYRRDAEYSLSPAEILLEKQWTKLIIDWPQAK